MGTSDSPSVVWIGKDLKSLTLTQLQSKYAHPINVLEDMPAQWQANTLYVIDCEDVQHEEFVLTHLSLLSNRCAYLLLNLNHTDSFFRHAPKSLLIDYCLPPFDLRACLFKINFLNHQLEKYCLPESLMPNTMMHSVAQVIDDPNFQPMFHLDAQGSIIDANHSAHQLLRASPGALIGISILSVLPKTRAQNQSIEAALLGVCQGTQESFRQECVFVGDDQTELPAQLYGVSTGANGALFICEDISKQKKHEQDLLSLAKYDVVTGLANRSVFFDFFQKAKIRTQKHHTMVALVYIHLENYQTLHSSLGHVVVDDLLVQFAVKLKQVMQQDHLVARMGTDMFAVLASDLLLPTHATNVAKSILNLAHEPFVLDNQKYFIRMNIGISLYPNDEAEGFDLERAAETALVQAKKQGANQFCYFESHMQTLAIERIKQEKSIKEAFLKQAFKLNYQPVVHGATGQLRGAEALLRWRDEYQCAMPTSQIIEIAEETSLIEQIGGWVLEYAFQDVRKWLDQGLFKEKILSINVSAKQLVHGHLEQHLSRLLSHYQIPSHHIELEITESSIIQDLHTGVEVLTRIRNLGCRIALDDFGMGYSSLSYLRHLPVDTIKVDRSFTRDLFQRSGSEEIIRAILALANLLQLDTIAEGVEDLRDLAYLQTLPCNHFQGFHFSEAVDNDKWVTMLQQEPFVAMLKHTQDLQSKSL